VSGNGISWAICKSAPRSRQITTPATHHSVFYRPDALHTAQPTVSKNRRQNYIETDIYLTTKYNQDNNNTVDNNSSVYDSQYQMCQLRYLLKVKRQRSQVVVRHIAATHTTTTLYLSLYHSFTVNHNAHREHFIADWLLLLLLFLYPR